MLHVKTEVRPSAIQGLGLFAAEPLSRGAIICRWDRGWAKYFTDETFALLPPLAQEYLRKYGWRNLRGRWVIAIDDSRFMNHSNTPNMTVIVTDDCEYESRAARDIEAGEELTEDYRQFDPEFDHYGRDWK